MPGAPEGSTPPLAGMPPVSTAPSFQAASPQTQGGSKKKLIMLIVGIVVLLALIVGGWFGYNKFFAGIKLEKYSNSNISLLVPAGYAKTEENGGATFDEKNASDDTKSTVIAYYQAYPEAISDDELASVKTELRNQLKSAAQGAVASSGETVDDLNITDTTFKGDAALKLTGTAKKDGKKIGDVTIVAVANKKAVYLVGVAAHTSDPGLKKKTNTIINSLEVKN